MTDSGFRVLGVFLYLISFSSNANAFPEMIRHGYANCSACHVSLTGGGVLNDYGRELSRELLATWKGNEKLKENQFLWGALGSPREDQTKGRPRIQDWLKLGGDIRSVYLYKNTDTATSGQTIFMQGDFEAAAVLKKLTIDATAGIEQPIPGIPIDFISRRHFVQYSLTDEFNLRAGRFIPAYGINTADHVELTRDPLRLGDQWSSYNFEASYITDKYNIFVTGILGRIDNPSLEHEKGGALQATYAPSEKVKLGGEVYFGENDNERRWLFGPLGLIGITDRLMLQSEIDFQMNYQKTLALGPDTQGWVSSQKLSYEITDGIWVFGDQEYGKFAFDIPLSEVQIYGVGMQFFPRTHFEFNVSFEKVRNLSANSGDFYDYAWLMTHFYL